MTALNKQALNPEELESALLELKRISEQPAVSTHYARVLRTHIANLNGALEAAEKRRAEDAESLAEAESQEVVDSVAANAISWMKRLQAAEKRIEEQNKTLMAARSYVKSHAAGDGHAFGVLQAIDLAAGIDVKGE